MDGCWRLGILAAASNITKNGMISYYNEFKEDFTWKMGNNTKVQLQLKMRPQGWPRQWGEQLVSRSWRWISCPERRCPPIGKLRRGGARARPGWGWQGLPRWSWVHCQMGKHYLRWMDHCKTLKGILYYSISSILSNLKQRISKSAPTPIPMLALSPTGAYFPATNFGSGSSEISQFYVVPRSWYKWCSPPCRFGKGKKRRLSFVYQLR